MGINPQMYVIIGIDDVIEDDHRRGIVARDYLEEILNFRELKYEEYWRNETFDDAINAFRGLRSKWLEELVYNPNNSNEYQNGNITGLILHAGKYDDNILRAMATIYPEFMENGYHRIPIVPVRYTADSIARGEYPDGYTQEDIDCNRVVPRVLESKPFISRLNWERAQHYLGLIGWKIPAEELRYLLVWDWS